MLRRKSTHKRKRSSARADQAKKSESGRIIANVICKEKQKSKEEDLAESRFLRSINIPLLHSLDVLIPCPSTSTSAPLNSSSRSRLMETLSGKLNKTQFQAAQGCTNLIRNAPLSLFLDPAFLTSHIRSGSLTMISSGSLDSDDVVCLDGKGTLILSVTKDTYQTLGLTGRPSRFSRGSSGWAGDRRSGKHERYIIEIDLLSPTFTPVHKGYKKVKRILDDWDASRREAIFSKPTPKSGDQKDKAAGKESNGDQDEMNSLLESLNPGQGPEQDSSSTSTEKQDQVKQEEEGMGIGLGSWNLLLNWVPSLNSIDPSSSSQSTTSADANDPKIHYPPPYLATLRPKEIKLEINSRIEKDVSLPDFNSGSNCNENERGNDVDALFDLTYGWKGTEKPLEKEKEIIQSRKDEEDFDERHRSIRKGQSVEIVPSFDAWKEKILGLGEWAGMNLDESGSERFKTFNEFSTYTSSYAPSFPLTQGELIHFNFKGLFGPRFVKHVDETIEQWITEERKSQSKIDGTRATLWSVLVGKCFRDAPISWVSNKERNLKGEKQKHEGDEGEGKEDQADLEVGVDADEEEDESTDDETRQRKRKRVRFSRDQQGETSTDRPSITHLDQGGDLGEDEDDPGDEDFESGSEDSDFSTSISTSSEEDQDLPQAKAATRPMSKSSSKEARNGWKPFSKDKRRKKTKKRGFVRSGERERAIRFGRDDGTGFLVLGFGREEEEKESDDDEKEPSEKQEEARRESGSRKKRKRDGTEIQVDVEEKVGSSAAGDGEKMRRKRARWIVLESVGLDVRN